MGLDMYLYRKRYIGKARARIEILENQYEWYKNVGLKKEIDNVTTITQEVGYWRKANQIHKWFVENIQNGEDDCRSYYVSYEKLERLLEICKDIKKHCKLRKGKVKNGQTLQNGEWHDIIEDGKVMTNKKYAEKLLPTSEGFFFGGTDYDEYYMDDINNTIEIIENILNSGEKGDIYYESSW